MARWPGWHAAALLALLLLSFANVQSIVMQAGMALSGHAMPICGGGPAGEARASSMDGMNMAGMDMDGMDTDGAGAVAPASPRDRHPDAAHCHGAACPYCAAAAHSPVPGHAAALPHAAGFVFAAFQVAAGRGPRGPPAREPRARGPPPDPPVA